MHVAEVDDARDRARRGARPVHEDVPVVGVAVDHAAPQPGRARARPRVSKRPRTVFHQSPPRRVLRCGPGASRIQPAAARSHLRSRVAAACAKSARRPVDARRAAGPGRGASRGVRGRASASGVPGHAGQHPRPGAALPPAGEGTSGSPAGVRTTRGSRELRSPPARGAEGRALQVHESALARRVHGLEHEVAAGGRGQPEIVVVLAREGRSSRFQPEEVTGGRRASASAGEARACQRALDHGRRCYPLSSRPCG